MRIKCIYTDGYDRTFFVDHPKIGIANVFQIEGKRFYFTGVYEDGALLCREALCVNLDVEGKVTELF